MNINYFKEFSVLAETKNYWEASERLFLNQSTLSKHIKSMETELGVPLFERTTRTVKLTDYGSALLPYAKSITQLQFEYSTMLLQKKNSQDNLVTIGSIPSMAQYHITHLLLEFQKAYPKITTKVMEDDSAVLKKMLLEKKCQLAFIRESKSFSEDEFFNGQTVERLPYMEDRLIAVLPPNHPLCGLTELPLRQLENEKLCFLKENTMLYNLCRLACQEANFIPNIVFDSHRLDSILDMVTNGGCIALLMDRHVNFPGVRQVKPPICTANIIPPITTRISLCYLKNPRPSKTARLFIDYYKKVSGQNQAPAPTDCPQCPPPPA